MSVAYLQHPVTYVTGYQYASNQQLMAPRQQFQMMWQARSMESGLGKKFVNLIGAVVILTLFYFTDYPSQFNANLYGFDKQDYRVVSRRPV